jgi:hypothetical protein
MVPSPAAPAAGFGADRDGRRSVLVNIGRGAWMRSMLSLTGISVLRRVRYCRFSRRGVDSFGFEKVSVSR